MQKKNLEPLFQFAHLSDLHFSKISFHPAQFLSKRWVGNFNFLLSRRGLFSQESLLQLPAVFRERGVDKVLITGDLSSTSQPVEFALAKEFVDLLKKEGFEVFVIPGNHDQYTKKSYRSQLFYDFFESAYPASLEAPAEFSYNLKENGLTVTYLGECWWLFAMDTAIATPLFSSSGLFSHSLEDHLTQALQKIPKDHQVILMNHFPIFSNESFRKGLVRKEALCKLLESAPQIRVYLHGHTHRQSVADLRNSSLPIVVDSGSTAQKNSLSWNLIKIGGNQCSVETFRGRKGDNSYSWEAFSVSHFQW